MNAVQLKMARVALGLTVRQAAELTGASHDTITRIEAGAEPERKHRREGQVCAGGSRRDLRRGEWRGCGRAAAEAKRVKPWLALWLTPFAALQLIVALRLGDEFAEALDDYSPRSWLMLHYRVQETESLSAAGPAFRAAEANLQSWCRQGLIKGFGVLDVASHLQRENLENWWSNARQLGFEHAILTGKPVLREIQLLGGDVRQAVSPPIMPAPAHPARPAPPSQTKIDELIKKRHSVSISGDPTIKQDWDAALDSYPGTRRNQIDIARKKIEPVGGYSPGVRKGAKRKPITPKTTAG